MAGSIPIGRGIVVGIELGAQGGALSHGSALALEQSELLARHFRVPVVLVHSTADDERWDEDRGEYVHREPLGAEGRAALEAALERLQAASLEARCVISEQHSVLAIVHEVSQARADLVVVGKRSSAAEDGRRLGSVARTLIHDCPSAVCVVRAAAKPPPARILAAADLTAVGERVLRTAGRAARALGSELHVVHALSLPLDVQLAGDEQRRRYLQRTGREAEQQLLAWLDGAPATLHVGLTSPTQAVLAGARSLAPALVVMGTVSRSGIPGLILGNTAERLLDRLDASLLVVKPEAELRT